MKTKLIAVLILISTSVFAQTKSKTALYTFCGKPCIDTLNFTKDELAKGNKLFLPINSGDKITSYVASLCVNGTYVDLELHGNEQNFMETINNMKAGNKLLISKMKMLQGNKTVSAPGVVIQIQ